MKKPVLTAVLLMVSAVPLAGCQGLFGGKHHARKDAGDAAIRDPSAYAAIQLTTGRKALDNRQYAEAITAFREARADPGLAADAYNGLAIAYAGLGRRDLAARYFTQAIALAPADERFKANLARLYKTSVVPMEKDRVQTAIAQAEQQAAEIAPVSASTPAVAFSTSTLKGPVSVARPGAEIIRVSAREVRIGTPAANAVRVGATARSAVRVEKPTLARPDAYPIRVSLGSAGGAEARPYPVKVGLTPVR